MATQLEQQIARLREIFSGGIGDQFSPQTYWNETGGETSHGYNTEYATNDRLTGLLDQYGLANKRQLIGRGGLTPVYGNSRTTFEHSGDELFLNTVNGDPTGYTYTLDAMRHPDRADKQGAYTISFNPDGSLKDVGWQNYEMSKGFFGDNMGWLGPLMVGGLAALGGGLAGTAGAAGGGASGAGAGGGYFGGLTAGAGGQTGLTAGAAGAAGISAPAGFVLAPEIGAAAAGAAGAGGYFTGLNPGQSGLGLQMPSAPSLGSMGGAQGVTAASVAPMSAGLVPATAATATPSLVQQVLNAGRAIAPYAQLAGPAMSLLGGARQLGSLPQQPADAPRLPGLEAPPEARGLQDPRAAIVDVLNRNRRANQNRTLLTGPRGVSMESVRARGNSLLGM